MLVYMPDLLPDLLMWRPHHVSPRLRWVSALSLCVADPGVTRRYRQRASCAVRPGRPLATWANLGRPSLSGGHERESTLVDRSTYSCMYYTHA